MQFIYLFFVPWFLFAQGRTFSEKPQYLDYKISNDKLPRQSILRFPKSGISISSFCVYKKNTEYTSRDCKAWSAYTYIDSGSLISLIREKGFFSEGDPPQLVASLICKEVKGVVESEIDEYNLNGRRREEELFCGFKDGSLAPYSGLILYIYRNAPNIKKEILLEKEKRKKKKL